MVTSNEIKTDYDSFSLPYKELYSRKYGVELLGLFYLAVTGLLAPFFNSSENVFPTVCREIAFVLTCYEFIIKL